VSFSSTMLQIAAILCPQNLPGLSSLVMKMEVKPLHYLTLPLYTRLYEFSDSFVLIEHR